MQERCLRVAIKDHSRAVVGSLLKVCPTSEPSHSCHSVYLSNANFIFKCDVSRLSRVFDKVHSLIWFSVTSPTYEGTKHVKSRVVEVIKSSVGCRRLLSRTPSGRGSVTTSSCQPSHVGTWKGKEVPPELPICLKTL